jgi:hypothetical protein
MTHGPYARGEWVRAPYCADNPLLGDEFVMLTTTGHPNQAGTTTVGRYLATRLAQLGAHHLFGLPGDFNLTVRRRHGDRRRRHRAKRPIAPSPVVGDLALNVLKH